MRRFGRILLRVVVAVSIAAIACFFAGLLVVRSGWFQERVRERIIAEIERVTGGRVEIGGFMFDTGRLEATVAPLVLHGKESAAEPPLLRVQSITLGLRIISIVERKVDLASMRVQQPAMRLVTYPDGSTNWPVPRVRHPETSWAEDLLNLSVRRYEINDGVFEYDDRQIPLNLRGEDLRIQTAYEPRGPLYRGNLTSQHVRALVEDLGPIELQASAAFTIDASRIAFSRLQLATQDSHFDLTGALEDVREPHGTFTLKGTIATREAVTRFDLPVAPTGATAFDGRITVSFAKGFDFSISGRATARGIGYTNGRLKISGAEARADIRLVPGKITLRDINAAALGSTVTGQADLERGRQFHFEGNLAGLNVRQAASIATDRPIAWDGIIAGPFIVDALLGQPTAKVQADVGITPVPGGTPLDGRLNVSYDQGAQIIQLGQSYLATSSTRVDLSGTLGKTMQVRAQSSNLDDFLPALSLADPGAPKELPLKLASGQATLSGTVAGTLDGPHFTGRVSLPSATLLHHPFDRFSGDVDATRQSVIVRNFSLARGSTTIEGQAEATPRDGKFEDASITAQLKLQNVSITEAAKEAGFATTISGIAGGTVRLSGTVLRPQAEAVLQVEKPAGFGEKLDRLRANVSYSPVSIGVTAGEADAGMGRLRFAGTYQHREGDWKDGDVRFDVAAQGVTLSRMEALKKLQPGLDAKLDGKGTGTAKVVAGELALSSFNGDASARAVTFQSEVLGDVSLTAGMQGTELAISTDAQVHESKIQGQGTWKLEGDEPGSGTLRFSRVSIETLHDLAMIGATAQEKAAGPSLEGFIEGSATFSVPLRKPLDFQSEVTLTTLQINPKAGQKLQMGVQPQDIVLKNTQPVVIAVSAKEARIRSARLIARNTNLEAAGSVPFDSRLGADLTVRGAVDLMSLQVLNSDLLAKGSANVQVAIRGTLQNPQLNGRMELVNASLYLGTLPNGIDNAHGTVLFDRNRATIEKLTAETGGGMIGFGGFLEFGTPLLYRVQADLRQVRVRYPEDVSTIFSGNLALNGSSDASTLSGSLTMDRATLNPRADPVQLLAQSAKLTPAPGVPSPYLRGMQFDVRVESSPNFELQTSLTRNVQAEIDLRLRGTPLNPALLGTVSVNEGEIQVLGNRYTIDRGDIRFVNPVKIEPTFDMDLETRAHGITVNVSFSGTLQKLNVNYSSDPPLQSREIIALLAVGRSPTEGAALANQGFSDTSDVATGGGLLGQAVSAQLSSRLQRFFGASRVKIDPTLTGVENVPQARLTLEQQVSKDVTLTYITNLNRTQEQIVQLQWDLSRQWSAIAVRDSNGLFGIDVQFRKRFK